ncbi:hypothetical protein PG997_002130 [Apiospora hydei]|uniref:AB hydrolase-1 domain-containing protein n=1 Tax=Apiospora hydei TaxID=1337664 RepID=A0ABR1X8M4_9PEZI
MLLLVPFLWASQAASAVLAPSADTPNPACDAACMAAFEGALAGERAMWATPNFADDPFYNTPANFTGAKPGDLLSWQDLSAAQLGANWTKIPGGMSLSRFLYVTEDVDRKPIPASAFVLLPIAPPAAGNGVYNTVAWTHGTAGRARQCAPSNNQQLYYEWLGPFFFASQGYAVVAPDYAGQGTEIRAGFHYEAGYMHAADVAYSLVAARKVLGGLLSDEWVVAGHSEGGMTAWRTNERLAMPGQEELLKAGKFLGAVAGSPALRPAELIPRSIELANGGPLGAPVSIYLLQNLVQIYPELKLEEILTERSLGLLPLLDQGCLDTGAALFGNMTTAETYKSTTWLTSPQFLEWQTKYNGAGPHPLAAPMLIVQGDADSLTYAENCEKDFNRTCEAYPESSVELYLVPELGHGPGFQAGQAYFSAWVARLFEGQTASPTCKKNVVKPTNFRYQHGRTG